MGHADRPTTLKADDGLNTEQMPIHDMWFIDRLATKVGVSPSPGMLYSLWSRGNK